MIKHIMFLTILTATDLSTHYSSDVLMDKQNNAYQAVPVNLWLDNLP